jgi:hypothetical protein
MEGVDMSDELREMSYYFTELSKMYNEALFLLKEASLEVSNQDLNHRIDGFLTQVEQKKRSA